MFNILNINTNYSAYFIKWFVILHFKIRKVIWINLSWNLFTHTIHTIFQLVFQRNIFWILFNRAKINRKMLNILWFGLIQLDYKNISLCVPSVRYWNPVPNYRRFFIPWFPKKNYKHYLLIIINIIYWLR